MATGDRRPGDPPASPAPAPGRRWVIVQEEAKLRQTGHWDWDCMSYAEIEARMREGDRRVATRRRGRRLTAAAAVAGATLAATGAYLLW